MGKHEFLPPFPSELEFVPGADLRDARTAFRDTQADYLADQDLEMSIASFN